MIDQKIYWKKMYTEVLNHTDNHCWQYYNELNLPQ